MQNSRSVIIWVVFIIVVLVLGTYLYSRNRGVETTPESNTETTLNNVPNTLTVKDQFPGDIVFISEMSLNQGAFVAVHKDNNGAPGAIVGTEYFEKGSTSGQLKLTEKTVNGGTYYVMLHNDDGDKKFDAAKDVPLRDDAGLPIMKSFKATTQLDGTKG